MVSRSLGQFNLPGDRAEFQPDHGDGGSGHHRADSSTGGTRRARSGTYRHARALRSATIARILNAKPGIGRPVEMIAQSAASAICLRAISALTYDST